MRTQWMWVAMFLLGAATAAGIGWMVAAQPKEAAASAPDRLGDNMAVAGGLGQGMPGYYLIKRDGTVWYMAAAAIDPKTLKMSVAPRRNLVRDIAEATKELRIERPRSLDFMMSSGEYSPGLDLVYVYEANTRVLIAYYFDVKKNEITRLSFAELADK
jgi:hypothetical protein